MLNSDNWLEIMRYLDIALPSLALTSKRLYLFYQQHKKLLCDEGNYRLSYYQRQLVHDISYREKPLVIQTNNNIGTKAAILSAAFKYIGTTVIVTSKKENAKWHKEIKK